MASCISAPKVTLNNEDFREWLKNAAGKRAGDDYENIYVFKKNGDIDYFVYSYKKPITEKLFKMKSSNEAYYYKKTKLKTFLIYNIPIFDIYNVTLNNSKDIIWKDYVYAIDKRFPNIDVYILLGYVLQGNKLKIARCYIKDYDIRVKNWMNKNGYGEGKNWRPKGGIDWTTYPIPLEKDIDWSNTEDIGELI